MDKKMEQQLNTWKAELDAKLGALQLQLRQTRAEEREVQEKLEAIDRLLGKSSLANEPLKSTEADDDLESFTPTKAYWRPILQVLVDLGSRARRERVMELVGAKMKKVLLPADYAMLPDSN